MVPVPVIQTLTSPWGIFLLILVGAICGLFVHAAAPQANAGLFGVLVRGFLGALAGVWVVSALQLPNLLTLNFGGLSFPLAWALLGGIMVMLMLRILRI